MLPYSRPSKCCQVLWPAEGHSDAKDADAALEATAKGDMDPRLQTASTLILSIAECEEDRVPSQSSGVVRAWLITL